MPNRNAITWDEAVNRIYETGVSKGVLYPEGNTAGTYGDGVAWNGLTSVNETRDGGDITTLYADNIEYLHITANEKFTPTIECYTYPDEFGPCIGEKTDAGAVGLVVTAQTRKMFGLCYRTEVGSEADNDLGYKIHIVYGCKAKPSDVNRETVNDSPEGVTFSFECVTTPIDMSDLGSGFKPSAHLVIDSRKASAAGMAALETLLYGSVTGESPSEVVTPGKMPTILEIKTALSTRAAG